MTRRAWILVVSVAVVAAALIIGFSWRRMSRAPVGAPPDASLGTGASAVADASVAKTDGSDDGRGTTDAAVPSSPYGAAAYHADELRRRCFPSRKLTQAEHQGPYVHHLFGHEASTVGVVLRLTENGELRGAKLWGGTRQQRSCLTAALERLPIGAGAEKEVTVQVPLGPLTWTRRPEGDVQLFLTGHYYGDEFSPGDVVGDWRAICVREGSSVLVPAPLTITPDEDEAYGRMWTVEARACPGPDVLLLKGPALASWRHETQAANAPPDAAAGDAGDRSGATDVGAADGVSLATLTISGQADQLESQGVTLAFGGRSGRLRVYPPGGGETQALVLESGSVAQVMIDNGNAYQILWAGDLDGDGKLDFVVNHTPEFPAYDLFLSSHAGGRLLRHAAGIARMGD